MMTTASEHIRRADRSCEVSAHIRQLPDRRSHLDTPKNRELASEIASINAGRPIRVISLHARVRR